MKFPGTEDLAAVMVKKVISYYLECIAGKEDMAMELLKKEVEEEKHDLQNQI